jgi:adenosylcobinamide-GDP ribazoletransferase
MLFAAFIAAIQTLTRIPVPALKRSLDAPTLALSAALYPVVGALLGLAAWCVYEFARLVFPLSIVALAILGMWMLLTGALHEDGLADVADAFGSQASAQDIHRVLKDSHIGTYGVLALIVSVGLRWQGLSHVPDTLMAAALMSMQVLPRAGLVTVAFAAGPATTGSGGTLAKSLRAQHVATAWLLAILIAAPFGWQLALLSGGVTLVVAAACQAWFHRRISGVTGDCLGACEQFQEIAVLMTVLLWAAL